MLESNQPPLVLLMLIMNTTSSRLRFRNRGKSGEYLLSSIGNFRSKLLRAVAERGQLSNINSSSVQSREKNVGAGGNRV